MMTPVAETSAGPASEPSPLAWVAAGGHGSSPPPPLFPFGMANAARGQNRARPLPPRGIRHHTGMEFEARPRKLRSGAEGVRVCAMANPDQSARRCRL